MAEYFAFVRDDGSFDYEAYVRAQTAANRRKLHWTYALPQNIEHFARYVQAHVTTTPTFGLCHGTRRGTEQRWFRDLLPGCDVIGTEIAPTAARFPHTIQWDFHETKPEWLGAADFVYSNSFDHAYNPQKALAAWMRCVSPHGVCLIEVSLQRKVAPHKVSASDPFFAPPREMATLMNGWGRADPECPYRVVDTFRTPAGRRAAYVVQHGG